MPKNIRSAKGIPPVTTVFNEALIEKKTPDRLERILGQKAEHWRIKPQRKRKPAPTLTEERLYQAVCAWKQEYETRFGLVKGGLWGWIQRNIRTWFSLGLLTVLFNLLVLLVKLYYGVP